MNKERKPNGKRSCDGVCVRCGMVCEHTCGIRYQKFYNSFSNPIHLITWYETRHATHNTPEPSQPTTNDVRFRISFLYLVFVCVSSRGKNELQEKPTKCAKCKSRDDDGEGIRVATVA